MVPELSQLDVFREHVLRYRFACGLISGGSVLDVACGEGYGTSALSRVADRVVGVDVDPNSVEHARAKYGVNAVTGSADCLPFTDNSFDSVVSFETIEHLQSPQRFVAEVARVLRNDGCAIISTPNRMTYRVGMNPNPFHTQELSFLEFAHVLGEKFSNVRYYAQGLTPPFRSCEAVMALVSSRGAGLISRLVQRVTFDLAEMSLVRSDCVESRGRYLELISQPASVGTRLFETAWPRAVTGREAESASYLVAWCRGLR